MKIYPMVARKDGKKRIGKGFSKSELKEAGVDLKKALRLTIPVDLRRETKHEENVKTLRQHLGLQVPKISRPPEPSKPVKAEVAEPKPAKPKKLAKKRKAEEVSKPSKRAKAAEATKAKKPAPKKSATRRKAVKSKVAKKT